MKQASVHIRAANNADIDSIREIEISSGSAFRAVPGLEWIADEDALPDAKIRGWVASGTAWVAEESDGRLSGFIVCENVDHASHIMQVSVRDDCQQRGIGRTLIDAATDAAREADIPVMTLTTFRDVAFNGPFYERIGFHFIDNADLDDRLQSILAAEEAAGLPIDRRCAMRMEILSV